MPPFTWTPSHISYRLGMDSRIILPTSVILEGKAEDREKEGSLPRDIEKKREREVKAGLSSKLGVLPQGIYDKELIHVQDVDLLFPTTPSA